MVCGARGRTAEPMEGQGTETTNMQSHRVYTGKKFTGEGRGERPDRDPPSQRNFRKQEWVELFS